MHPQLQKIADEFDAAEDRLHRLVSQLPDNLWSQRADPDRWSPAECVVHLNLTSRAYIPILEGALDHARDITRTQPTRYRRDLLGWLLWSTMGPPVRLRTRTAAAFIPGGVDEPATIVAEFEELQRQQLEFVRQSDGLDLAAVRVASPFNPKVKYNLFSCLGILPRHQDRHLWQAERVAEELLRSG